MMTNRIAGQLGGVPYKYFGDWTDRVAKGELPKNKPQRPSGVERNHRRHDLGLVDARQVPARPDLVGSAQADGQRRRPAVTARRSIRPTTCRSSIRRPTRCRSSRCRWPIRSMPVSLGPGHAGAIKPTAPSAYWGDEVLWDTKANNHNAMFDKKGRVWLAATVRGMDNPAWCKKGSEHPSAKVFPIDKQPASGRGARSQDQGSTSSSTPASARTIRSSATTPTTRCGCPAPARWRAGSTPRCSTRPATPQKAVGWFPFVLDTNGNGKLDEFAEPGKPEEGKDTRFNPGSGPYAVMPHPTDGSIWYTSGTFGGRPGFLRFDPKTKLSEFFAASEGGRRRARRRHRRGRRALGLGLGRPSDRVRPQASARPRSTGRTRPAITAPKASRLHKYPGPGFDERAELQRRGELLHLGRSSQRGRPRRRTCRSRPPTFRTASSASRTAR